MSIFEIIGLIAGMASIAGLFYAIYYARRSRRIKFLVYEVSDPVPLASTVSPGDEYSLSVVFQRAGLQEERIKSVYVRFLRFANLGREPIRRDAIAPANPIKVIIEGTRALDIALEGVTRLVNKVAIGGQVLSENVSFTDISFDFLDHKDGALIKVLTVSGKNELRLSGDIIGMPEGIKNSNEIGSLSFLNKIGCALAGLLLLAAFVLSILAFYWVTGSWNNIWLLALPWIALILPGIIIAVIGSLVWPGRGLSFPSDLELPHWFRSLEFYYRRSELRSPYTGLSDEQSNIIDS